MIGMWRLEVATVSRIKIFGRLVQYFHTHPVLACVTEAFIRLAGSSADSIGQNIKVWIMSKYTCPKREQSKEVIKAQSEFVCLRSP